MKKRNAIILLLLGDTLWLEADFPDSLQDFYSREWIYIGPGFEFSDLGIY
jgi:hypothetical protein